METPITTKFAATARKTLAARGFTLIELMVTITIIIVIAAIAIPNLIRSRMTANEGAAIGAMRTIGSAEQQFQSAAIAVDAAGVARYGTLAELMVEVPSFVDATFSSGARQGYNFAVVLAGAPGSPAYAANADPMVMDGTGSRGFFTDESGVITFKTGAVAGPGDPAVQ